MAQKIDMKLMQMEATMTFERKSSEQTCLENTQVGLLLVCMFVSKHVIGYNQSAVILFRPMYLDYRILATLVFVTLHII